MCHRSLVVGGLLVLLALVAGSAATAAQQATPAATPVTGGDLVFPIDAPVFGVTYAEWGARHMQWLLSFPTPINPATDETGDHCGYGQAGPVFFLAPVNTPTQVAERECTIPAGVAVFIPVFGVECSTAEEPPFFGRDEAELRAACRAFLNHPATLTATVNGQAIPDLERYRMQSEIAPVVFPGDNLYGVTPGVAAAVTDGYWLLLTPLPPGGHELRFGGALPAMGVRGAVTYRLTVAEPEVSESSSSTVLASPAP
jgi:hypothetical protein